MKKILTPVFSLALLGALIIPSISSAAAPKTCITVWEHANYKGKSKKFCSNVKNLTNYKFNDKISSFRVSGNNKVELFKDANYKGSKLVVMKDTEGSYVENLKELNKNKGKWNDSISSIKIFNK